MRIRKAVMLAAALLALPATQLARLDGTEPGEAPALLVLAVVGGFLAFMYFPPIALSLRDAAPWAHVGAVVLAIAFGHAIAILTLVMIDTAIPALFGYAASSATATWWLLRQDTQPNALSPVL